MARSWALIYHLMKDLGIPIKLYAPYGTHSKGVSGIPYLTSLNRVAFNMTEPDRESCIVGLRFGLDYVITTAAPLLQA